MKVNLAKAAGFCFGVKRAIDIALQAAKIEKNVMMLGDIVHNETVVEAIKRTGIRKIRRLGRGTGKTLLIRAHGTQRKVFDVARAAGYRVIDATCPMVKEIHAIAKKMEDEGRRVVIIGDRNHDEVRGIVGQLSTVPVTINDPDRIPLRTMKAIERAGIVVQSTQDIDKVLKIVERLRIIIPDVKFNNTICNPTRIKQDEARRLPRENDVVIVIGSSSSANTKRIYEISRSVNPRTYWVNSAQELRARWFEKAKSIGVMAGASTPESTISEVLQRLKKLSN